MEERAQKITKEYIASLTENDIEFTLLKDEKVDDVTYYLFQVTVVPLQVHYLAKKRHSEFETFYEALCITFPQLEFPKPPSKFRILQKVKLRIDYYILLLQSIKSYMTKYPEYKHLFMSKIYQFFVYGSKIMKELEPKIESK